MWFIDLLRRVGLTTLTDLLAPVLFFVYLLQCMRQTAMGGCLQTLQEAIVMPAWKEARGEIMYSKSGRKLFYAGAVALVASLAGAPGTALAASGTVELKLTYVGVGVGFHGGDATVTLRGKSAQFKVRGANVLGAGISGFKASGKVTGAKSLDDIAGKYKVTRGSFAVGVGAIDLTLENDKGVKMTLNSTNAGAELSIGPGELTFTRK